MEKDVGVKRFGLMVALAASLVVGLSSTSIADAPDTGSTAKASAYVGPSVVHVETTYRAKVFNANVPAYVPDEAGRPKVFTVTVGCTGFIVNSAGYVATAGHCVDPKAINRRFVEAAVAWYIRLGADGTPSQVLQQADFVIRTANPDSERRNADRGAIRVAWGSADSQQKKARLINAQSAAQGDAALLRIGGTDLRAVELAKERAVELLQAVVDAQPTHPTAQLYADRARELSEGSSSGFPIALVLGLAVTVVAVIGAIALLMRLARRERPDVRDEVVARRLESLIDPPAPDREASISSDVGEHEHMERR